MIGKLRNFWGDNKGVAAIEFALIATPFFLLLFGIVETGIFYASNIVLEGGAAEASRIIRTGQITGNSGQAQAAFAANLCTQISGLIPCNSVQYEVITMPNDKFTDAQNYQPQYDANGNFVPRPFNAGGACDVVLIRAVYTYNFMIPMIGNLMNGGVGKNLMSTAVIKNEPYTGIASC